MLNALHSLVRGLRPWVRRLPLPVQWRIRQVVRFVPGWPQGASASYDDRYAAELGTFADQLQVHDLPPIFHYWSNTWLRPQLEAFGFSDPDGFLVLYADRAIAAAEAVGRVARLASLGSGNCDTEIRVAQRLLEGGRRDFVIECVDINDAMLARGRALAAEFGVAAHIEPVRGDFNDWRPPHRYDAVIANQSLHHVTELENLLTQVEAALVPGGAFITSDIIGRNGHRRWPEAMAIVQEFWKELPKSHRRNLQLGRYEKRHLDWDCSTVGFEGIRAQDILPLLVERFDFAFFLGFGNVIDPFIDRAFGPHFDADGAWDRDFIDRVHRRDDAEILAGRIQPTHMLAVMHRKPWAGQCLHREHLTPAFCTRPPD